LCGADGTRGDCDAGSAGGEPWGLGLWVIGFFARIDLIFYGCARIALALGLRAM
jgi:hypothetical protein